MERLKTLDREVYGNLLASFQPKVIETEEEEEKELLAIFDSQETVSEVINGQIKINKVQAKNLGIFFNVSPALFT